jgi:hypothetical protein
MRLDVERVVSRVPTTSASNSGARTRAAASGAERENDPFTALSRASPRWVKLVRPRADRTSFACDWNFEATRLARQLHARAPTMYCRASAHRLIRVARAAVRRWRASVACVGGVRRPRAEVRTRAAPLARVAHPRAEAPRPILAVSPARAPPRRLEKRLRTGTARREPPPRCVRRSVAPPSWRAQSSGRACARDSSASRQLAQPVRRQTQRGSTAQPLLSSRAPRQTSTFERGARASRPLAQPVARKRVPWTRPPLQSAPASARSARERKREAREPCRSGLRRAEPDVCGTGVKPVGPAAAPRQRGT